MDGATEDSLTAHAKRLRELPTEELRIALALNGGVSLAVWMGGVAHELNRLTLSTPDRPADYGPVLAAARTTAIIDVIAGTSAGGINGAALALAQVNQGADLRGLRTLWAEQGRMEELLRQPFRGKPTSLLRGDDYFLPELARAMKMLTEPWVPRGDGDRSARPMDLTLTTTLLKGAQDITIDGYGEKIPQRVHAGTFRFSNVADDGRQHDEDPFAADRIKETARKLALAARCTASFPVAFEPSFVPVGESCPEDELRPDMARHASWSDRRDGGEVRSRYAMDGGVLANTPVTHALQAIQRRVVDRPVRRSMMLVYPHAPQVETVRPDLASEPPSASGALAAVFSALQAQGSRSYVERIEEHNRRAAEWVGSRQQLLVGFREGDHPVKQLYDMLENAWPHYRHIRMRQAAQGLAGTVVPAEHWPYERILKAAQEAQRAWVEQGHELPYVPRDFTWARPSWRKDHVSVDDAWRWGDSAAVGVADAVADVLRAALSVVGEDHKAALAGARAEVGEQIARIRRARAAHDRVWTANPVLGALRPDHDYWRARILAYRAAMLPAEAEEALADLDGFLTSHGPAVEGRPTPEERRVLAEAARELAALAGRPGRDAPEGGGQGKLIASAVRVVIDELVAQQATIRAVASGSAGGADVSGVAPWAGFLFATRLPAEPWDEHSRLELRLLALDAATRLMTGGTPTDANMTVRLAELSLRVSHPWAHLSTRPEDKAAGLQLARFGGFLKRSWRVNDWIWGRLDAITEICLVVLEPGRLKRLAAMFEDDQHPSPGARTVAEAIFEAMRAQLYGEAELPPHLQHLAGQARRELADALDPDKPERLHLPMLAQWAALPLQAEVILEELPVLRTAVNLDVEDGAGKPTRGTRFLVTRKDLLDDIVELGAAPPGATTSQERLQTGCEALAAFDNAGIGRETLAEETGSNALIRTANNAAGVLATVLDADADRMPAAKPITSAVRGAMMLPYWLVAGLAGGGRIARFLATIGLLVGGLFLVLSLFGVLGSLAAVAGLVGAASLLAALAYSALKTGSLLHACALLAPVAPMVAFAQTRQDADPGAANRVLVVIGALGALYALANIPWPMASPLAWATSRWKRLVGGLVAVAAVGTAGWWITDRHGATLADWWTSQVSPVWEGALARLADQPWLQAALIAVVTGIGGVIAYHEGARLRTWQPSTDTPTTYPARSGARGNFTRHNVRDPAGVAATWAPVYGLGYFLLAWAFWHQASRIGEREPWEGFTVWWLACLGTMLCIVAPVLVARGPRQRLRHLLARSWPQLTDLAAAPAPAGQADRLPGEEPQQLMLYALLKYELAFGYLVRGRRVDERGRPGRRTVTAAELALTHAGRTLLAEVREDVDARASERRADRAGRPRPPAAARTPPGRSGVASAS